MRIARISTVKVAHPSSSVLRCLQWSARLSIVDDSLGYDSEGSEGCVDHGLMQGCGCLAGRGKMNLQTLGFDEWFDERSGAMLPDGQIAARVMTVNRGAVTVQSESGETVAELSGKFRFAAKSNPDRPCVGDWVCVEQTSPTLAIIHAVLPRKTLLRRKRPGNTVDYQVIAANVDGAFIVQSCHYDFNVRRLDRYLVMAREGHIEPVIVLSKTDLVSPEELDELVDRVRSAGISASIVTISNTTGKGLDEFRELIIPGKTFCLLGSSGVGKTTILNRLIGHDSFSTQAVSATGEGVHTTSRRQLHLLDNGAMLVDTPGMRELGLLGTSDGMDDSFADIHDLSRDCRFSDCTHSQEPGCRVLIALNDGTLSRARYESYLKLRKETDHHDRSYVQKRKKDRDFGRFIKSVKKHGRH
jgi:ribosome biogenesis GTPase